MRFLIRFLLILSLFASSAVSAAAAPAAPKDFRLVPKPELLKTTAIHQQGITWTFSDSVEYNQDYYTGYYIIKNGKKVEIIDIQPGMYGCIKRVSLGNNNPLRRAIARFDVVPYQIISNPINIGVLAYHMNGIECVIFEATDGNKTEKIYTDSQVQFQYLHW
ncbi:MAG: hypothetical protein P8Y63_09755 [Deltaproteobacteria bacterium]